MKITHILVSIIALFLCVNCANKDYTERLNAIEQMSETNSDSAIALLKDFNIQELPTDELKARYALLKTHVLTKFTGASVSDSIINISVDYYKEHNDNVRNLALSLLYQANYLTNKGQLDNAMLNLLQVEELFPDFEDDFAKGYYNVLLGVIYAYNRDFSVASEAYQQAYSYFIRIDNAGQWKTLTRLSEGVMYYNMSMSYDTSIKLFVEALNGAEQMKQESLITLCKALLIVTYTETKQLEKAYALMDDVKDKKANELSNNIHAALYSSLSYLYYCKGDKENGARFMNQAKEHLSKNSGYVGVVTNRMIDIAILKEDYKEAFQLSQENKKALFNKMLTLLERPLMTSQRDCLKKELEQNKQMQKIERQRNIAIVSLILIFSIVVILYLRKLNKDKQHKLDEYADIVIDLQSTLQKSESAATELVQTLYKEQFKILNGISDTFFSQNNDAKGQKYVYNEVKYLIEQFSKDKKALQELENTVNKCCNNVMAKLRTELPSLDELDYRQLCYHYAGFSGKLISILLDKSQANIYMRKSRLKEKISQSNAPSKEEILSVLG